MKKNNVLQVFDTNENDNVLTAYAKGGAKGIVLGSIVMGAWFGTIGLIGKHMAKNGVTFKEQREKREEEVESNE